MWKMNFNPNLNKQAQKVIFSQKLQKTNHNLVYFNQNSVKQVPSQKHLGIYVDTKLNLQVHLTKIIIKVIKTFKLLRERQAVLPRQYLVTVYKACIKPHLIYGNISDNQISNDYLHKKW